MLYNLEEIRKHKLLVQLLTTPSGYNRKNNQMAQKWTN